MHILTSNGEIIEGIEITPEELNVIKHFSDHINEKRFITNADKTYITAFLLKYYQLTMRRREAHQTLEAKTTVETAEMVEKTDP